MKYNPTIVGQEISTIVPLAPISMERDVLSSAPGVTKWVNSPQNWRHSSGSGRRHLTPFCSARGVVAATFPGGCRSRFHEVNRAY
jgi:hypothetical protein